MKKNKVQLTPYQIREKRYKSSDNTILLSLAVLLGTLYYAFWMYFDGYEIHAFNNQTNRIILIVLRLLIAALIIWVWIDTIINFKKTRREFEHKLSSTNGMNYDNILLIAHGHKMFEDTYSNRQKMSLIEETFKINGYKVVFAPKLNWLQNYYIDDSINVHHMLIITSAYGINKR